MLIFELALDRDVLSSFYAFDNLSMFVIARITISSSLVDSILKHEIICNLDYVNVAVVITVADIAGIVAGPAAALAYVVFGLVNTCF